MIWLPLAIGVGYALGGLLVLLLADGLRGPSKGTPYNYSTTQDIYKMTEIAYRDSLGGSE